MCRGYDHGGRRCPSDTAEARRLRYKANKARTAFRNAPKLVTHPQQESVASYSSQMSFDEVVGEAVALRKKIYDSSPSEESDDRLAAELLAVGEAVADEAERRAGIDYAQPVREYEKNIASGMSEEEASRVRLLSHRANRETLKQAYIEVLSEIRPLGGRVLRTSESEEADSILARTVEQHYPTEWIEYSNNGPSFILRHTQGDPSYSREKCGPSDEGAYVSDRKLPAIYRFDSRQKAEEFATRFGDDAEIVSVNAGDSTTYQVSVKYEPGELYDSAKHKPMMGGRPIGKEWVRTVTPLVLGTKQYADSLTTKTEQQRLDMLVQPRWVRPETVYNRRTLNLLSAEDPHLADFDDKESAVNSIAYHEFGHRMEEVLPDNVLPRMEESFLRRRSGKTVTSFRESMLTEVTNNYLYHDAGLVDKYAGRDYLNGNYEVFTVGVESLLGKNYGSLSGQHQLYKTEDRSHKAFVLGALATL